MTDVDALTFAQHFLSRGMEFVLRGRGRRLHVWPAKAWDHLTEAEHEYIDTHRDELKELTRAKALPETTVVWSPPSDAVVDSNVTDTTTPAAPDAAPVDCLYCERPCVGEAHELYWCLHWRDPAQVARRDAEATAEMRAMVGRS